MEHLFPAVGRFAAILISMLMRFHDDAGDHLFLIGKIQIKPSQGNPGSQRSINVNTMIEYTAHFGAGKKKI